MIFRMNVYKPLISLIAAVADNGVIGLDNRLPWRLPADLRHFKTLTLGKPIVMGRKTWESLPGMLPQRRHIVVTSNPGYEAVGCDVVHSLEQALVAAGDTPEVMIIGGARLYQQALPHARRMYLTLVHAQVAGNVFFPAYDAQLWTERERVEHRADAENPYPYTFLMLERQA
jgi:dihydrofolate reductase